MQSFAKKTQYFRKFNLKHDYVEKTAALRLVWKRNTGIVPFELHFGLPPNTVPRKNATTPMPKNVGYSKILDYLDKLQLGPSTSLLCRGLENRNRSLRRRNLKPPRSVQSRITSRETFPYRTSLRTTKRRAISQNATGPY